MLDQKQLRKVWFLSDNVLYREAVAFLHKLVYEQECDPLPTSQVTGLLNIALLLKYGELEDFIQHQLERNWPPGKRDIKILYTALEEVLGIMRRKRLKDEFHLLDGVSAGEIRRETDALMALLAREFIQHMVAENGRLAVELSNQRPRQRSK